MEKLHRMVSIDLNTPTPSIISGVYNNKGTSNQLPEHNKKTRLKSLNNNEPNIYDKYFQKRIAKYVCFAQLFFAVIILICQLSATGLLIGPVTASPGTALSTSDRVGLGIWASIVTTLALGATFWAINKTNFCRLHTSMLLHCSSLMVYIILEYFLLMSTIPHVQGRIYFLQENMPDDTMLDARRQLLNSRSGQQGVVDLGWGVADAMKAQVQMQAELHRLYAALVLSILMALSGIIQLLLHFFMSLKTGRAICLGKTYFEGKLQYMQSIGGSWRNKSFRFDSKDGGFELPKLERSDTLPPPPYESGYFHPSLN